MRRVVFASILTLAFAAPAAAQDDDVGAAVEAICCGAECCSIGGTCFNRGDENPMNSNEICDPSVSQDSFTTVEAPDAGTTTPPPDDDGGCSVGTGASSAPAALLALVGGLALFRRRRRR